MHTSTFGLEIDDHLDGMIVRGRFVFTFKRNLSDPRNYVRAPMWVGQQREGFTCAWVGL